MPHSDLPPSVELPLLDAAAARAGDAAAVASGDTWPALMARAAGHLARGTVAAAGHGYGLRVAILVGKGNNGGDGWAAALRLEREHGAKVWVLAPDGADVPASAETEANRHAWLRHGGRVSSGTDDLDAALAWSDVAVDALLGTGVSGAPRGASALATAALLRARGQGTTIVACDMPSGVSSDDGGAPEGSVRADVTITFGGLKRGLLLHPGAGHAGRVVLADLGPRYDPGTSRWAALTPAGAAPQPLDADADKRARGVVLAIAGASGTGGAAALTATGALRAGAGLVTVATPEPIRGDVAAHADAGVMVRGLPADELGRVSGDAVQAIGDLAGVDVVVAGPGLGVGQGTRDVLTHLRAHAPRLVVDADAINVHRDDPAVLADHVGELVLTPHERELARIGGGVDGPDAWARRVERVPELAQQLRATIVAKGPGTLVAAPDGRVWVTPLGGPALGSGGTGDVLAGIVAAAVATADDVPLAVARAVWWHAAAGMLAGRARADRATATDLLRTLPATLAALLGIASDPGAAAAASTPGPESSPAGGRSRGTRPGGGSRGTRPGGGSRGTRPSGGSRGMQPGTLPWEPWREGRP